MLVVGLSILLLMLVFRSILVPLKAAAGFLLTVGATFGITVAVFQQGHLAGLIGVDTPGPLVSFLPILLIGILFGLAMDYEVFLVSRMREDHVHGAAPRQATVSGLGHNARVVTAAALIMISVFGGFVLARPDHQVDRVRAGDRGVRRRVRRPDDARTGRDVTARRGRLVAARLPGPGTAELRHRGRKPHSSGSGRPRPTALRRLEARRFPLRRRRPAMRSPTMRRAS